MKTKTAINHINKKGILLVFPIKNAEEPESLWSQLYPDKKMVWSWDEDHDDSVGELWSLMKHLSDCGEVVYSKWYQNRATFFSKQVFVAMMRVFQDSDLAKKPLSENAAKLYEVLEMDSPLSTKELKKMTELQGKFYEATFTKSLKELFLSFRIVAYGESIDGAFPSLNVGATKLIFEDLVLASQEMSLKQAQVIVNEYLPLKSKFGNFLYKLRQPIHERSRNR